MTVFAKDTVYGLETTIKDLQGHINNKIAYNATYNPLGWQGTVNVYGICYPTYRNGNKILESYKGTGIKSTEYGEIFINDKVTASIGFVEVGDRRMEDVMNVDVDIITTMRLDIAYNSDLRNDELAMLQFGNVLKSFYGIYNIIGLKIGVDDVFAGYYFDNIIHNDIHPWLVFSMRVNLKYENDICL